MLTGEYNEYGYIIYRDGVEIYQAGNSPYDSVDVICLEDAIPPRVLRGFCKCTMGDLAKELTEETGTIERI